MTAIYLLSYYEVTLRIPAGRRYGVFTPFNIPTCSPITSGRSNTVLSQGRQQLVERCVEFRDAFVLKLLSHLVDTDAQFR